MKLPHSPMTRWRLGATRLREPNERRDEGLSPVTPQAQQGVEECQDQCDQMHPDNPAEQLECYKRECWS